MKSPTPNPSLKPLGILVGEWSIVGSHPLFPGKKIPGRVSFEWIEAGAFLITRSSMEDPAFPKGTAIFGYDEATQEGVMLYFDDRGVSRNCRWTMKGNALKWWREAPGFSQRYSLTVSDDGDTIIGKGELSKDGTTWEKDLDLTYTRII